MDLPKPKRHFSIYIYAIDKGTKQCDQIGRFLTKFYFKSSPNIWDISDIFTTIILSITAVATLWATLGEIGLFLILLSGHTGRK